ncbi:MAG: hypothetical protein RL145_906 [Pseudomonadota bacterium]|jgi:hypothetical protein
MKLVSINIKTKHVLDSMKVVFIKFSIPITLIMLDGTKLRQQSLGKSCSYKLTLKNKVL